MQTITILGATGSIGLSTLDVIDRHREKFQLYAVTANTNVADMLSICLKYRPKIAVMVDVQSAESLALKLKYDAPEISVLSGEQGLNQVCAEPVVTTVMAAIVGGAGLLPTLTATQQGKRVLLANKESLVMSGELLLSAAKQSGAQLLPVDSEHNAIFQSLPESVHKGASLTEAGVNQILLTGSGGPFRTTPLSEFEGITPAMAVAHPNWSMGAKISVDSATMINKGLEFIEARLLFNASFEQIKVLVHPQSIIHSMVSYVDGSVIAQMGQPDMRTPIAHTLSYPERIESGVAALDFTQVANFTFSAPDFDRFPNLRLALEASQQGQGATTVLNAANEVTVAAFLAEKINFNHISDINEQVLTQLGQQCPASLSDILELDLAARDCTNRIINSLMSGRK